MNKEWAVEVEREALLPSSFRIVQEASMPDLMAPKMRVTFCDEPAQDEGGVIRDWFDSIGTELTKEASEGPSIGAGGDQPHIFHRLLAASGECLARAKLVNTSDDKPLVPLMAVHPEDKTLVLRPGTERWDDFYALGRLLGLAVNHHARLPLHLNRATWKLLIGREIEANDLFAIDPVFFTNRIAAVMAPGGVQEVSDALCEPLCFVSAESPLCPEAVELVPGGREMLVTEDNKVEYTKYLCEFYLCGQVRQEWQLVCRGFQDLVPDGILMNHDLSERDVELLLVGIPTIEVKDWREHTNLDGPLSDAPQGWQLMGWFWEVVEKFGDERRAKLLQFATGSSRLPADGFKGLEPKFRLYLSKGDPGLLPTASTCINQLTLAPYPSKHVLIEKLSSVCHDKVASMGFGFL